MLVVALVLNGNQVASLERLRLVVDCFCADGFRLQLDFVSAAVCSG